MQNLIDVLEYLDVIEFFENMPPDETLLSTSKAFDNTGRVKSIKNDSNSLKEALDEYDKIFMAQGVFSYDDNYESCFIFDEYDVLETSELDDEYYDKYKFQLAGYGFYIDKYLNLEPGYFTIEAPPSGHGPGGTTFDNLKDAKEGDIIKEKINSLIDYDLWEIFYMESINYIMKNNQFNPKILELTNPLIQFIFDKSFDYKDKEKVLNDLIKYTRRINDALVFLVEDSPEDISSDDSEFHVNDSSEDTKIFGECPYCGKEVSKKTKNTVIIKCSKCEKTFFFD